MSGLTWKEKMPGSTSIKKGLSLGQSRESRGTNGLKTDDLVGIILNRKEEMVPTPTLMMFSAG